MRRRCCGVAVPAEVSMEDVTLKAINAFKGYFIVNCTTDESFTLKDALRKLMQLRFSKMGRWAVSRQFFKSVEEWCKYPPDVLIRSLDTALQKKWMNIYPEKVGNELPPRQIPYSWNAMADFAVESGYLKTGASVQGLVHLLERAEDVFRIHRDNLYRPLVVFMADLKTTIELYAEEDGTCPGLFSATFIAEQYFTWLEDSRWITVKDEKLLNTACTVFKKHFKPHFEAVQEATMFMGELRY
jgi:hypothetical protein